MVAILGSIHVLALTMRTCSNRHLIKEMSSSSVSNPPSATSMSYKGASKGKGKGVVKVNVRIISLHLLILMERASLEVKVLPHIKARDLQKVRYLKARVRDLILVSRCQR